MHAQSIMTLLTAVEFLAYAGAFFLFRRRRLQGSLPALGHYLILHLTWAPICFLLLSGWLPITNDLSGLIYFFASWSVYIASAAFLFLICQEIYRSILTPLPGLTRLGVLAFRWAAVISVIVTFSTLSYSHFSLFMISEFALGLMRAVSLIEICLLAFICLSMNALRLSARDRAFGIALGMGLMATNDLVASMLFAKTSSMTAPIQFVYESVLLIALGIWGVYCYQPEPVRQPVVLPMKSALYRWNEIANALGRKDTQIVLQQPITNPSFFLSDVEKIVDEALERNLMPTGTDR